jgi:bifunctional DNase/RNase
MKVLALSVDPMSNLPIVVLVDDHGRSHLPIAIGLGEAAAIAAELDDIELERPMTHQLCCELLARAGASIARIELTDGDDGAVVAHVVARTGKGQVTARARPSDAIALALRADAELCVDPAVIERAARAEADLELGLMPQELVHLAGGVGDGGTELLAALDAGAFGKWKM